MSEKKPEKAIQPNPSLEQAWKLFALYDDNAIRQQKNSNRFQLWILILGVLSTILVLTQAQLIESLSISETIPWLDKVFQYAIIIMPITISVLVAASNRFKSGNKWILLRAGAEAIKREIYKYRILTGIYVKQPEDEFKYKEELVNKISQINTQLMQTEVNLAALKPYTESIPPKMYGASAADDGFSFLPPEGYLEIRLGDQVNYYQSKITRLGKRLKRLQWSIYIIGGLGTLLAAVGLELWVALTTTIVGTFSTYLEYQQTENSLMIYNQAAASLTNIQTWWTALPDKKRKDPESIKKLVDNTEKVLQNELKGWVQQMEDALADLQAKPEASKDPRQ